jgi:hypothetical protein
MYGSSLIYTVASRTSSFFLSLFLVVSSPIPDLGSCVGVEISVRLLFVNYVFSSCFVTRLRLVSP